MERLVEWTVQWRADGEAGRMGCSVGLMKRLVEWTHSIPPASPSVEWLK